ncbi:MAG: hypothetical protein ACLFPP_09210 [Spirochaetaceae bacterium]
MHSCFIRWVEASGKLPIQMVSGWAAANGVVMEQVKTDEHSAENFAMMRRIALSIVKRCTTSKRSLLRRSPGCTKLQFRNIFRPYLKRREGAGGLR